MGERKWTEEQLTAIELRDRTLLVSAAAGSGKTATLTERIIRSLTDEKNPVDIDSLLVVTFTNAAAAELREKLSRALTEAVEKNPGDRRLERQLFMLGAAKIRTIDAFCSELLRSFSERVGVPPGFRIADTAECELLASAIADGLIEAIYNGELTEVATPEELAALADCLTDSGRSGELSEIFRFLRERCDASELGVESLFPLVEAYNPEKYSTFESTSYGEYIMERVREMARHYTEVWRKYARVLSPLHEGEKKLLDVISADLLILSAFEEAKSYTDMRTRLRGFEFMRMPALRADKKTERTESFAALRRSLRDDSKELAAYFSYSDEDIKKLFGELYSHLSVLYRFLLRFDSAFLEEKRRRGALSYADIERYAYKCLTSDGKPTDIAINLRERFKAIYIDEYQDVNSLQNSIFEAISRPDNRFMVGDIKQSIYGFREACPDIFASMKESYPAVSDSECGGCASVFMSKNFRCDEGIVDFVNSIFDKAFGLIGSSIGYAEGDRLVYGKIHTEEPKYRAPEIYLLEKPERDADGEDINPTSPSVVAEKISELLAEGRLDSGEPIRPSDIAIILRNASGKDVLYAEALTERAIPVKISGAKDFFLSSEVLLALALLNAIDNPRRDIYLAAAMCSPLFGFSPDELYVIRREGEGESLYEALLSYSDAHPEYSRARNFIDRLRYYRTISEGVGADVLIYKLYRETGLLALASKSGGRDNLMLLYDYSRTYESGSFCGLYNFISFINSVIDKKTAFDEKRESDARDAVNIITAHSSKGLEYPVVIFAESGARFRNRDKANRLAFSSGFGIAFRTRTPSGLALVNNPIVDIINHRIYRKMYEEELRVLYVALTRARERLYIFGASPTEDRGEYLESVRLSADNLSEYSLRALSSNLEVMLALSGREPKLCAEREECEALYAEEKTLGAKKVQSEELCQSACDLPQSVSVLQSEDSENTAQDGSAEADGEYVNPELFSEYSRRFSFVYPREALTELPEKMSVSKTAPNVLDGSDGEELFAEKESTAHRAPAFIEGRAEKESAKRGIATHYMLQFCDLDLLASTSAEAELARLVERGFISRRDAERVRIDEIERFRQSELFRDMREARAVHRELRFNLNMPAELFSEEEERLAALRGESVLVQGVIDCIIEYPDGTLGVFDYKTDRLTREELRSRELAEKRLRESHRTQLGFYREAVSRIFGKEPARVEVYSLHLADTVSMK